MVLKQLLLSAIEKGVLQSKESTINHILLLTIAAVLAPLHFCWEEQKCLLNLEIFFPIDLALDIKAFKNKNF